MKKTLWLLPLLCFSCSRRPDTPQVSIRLVDSGKAVSIAGIDPAIMGEIARDTSRDSWQTLAAIYRMPKDTDLKDYQSPQPGRYQVSGGALVFNPDTAFASGQTYFLRYYDLSQAKSAAAIVKDHRKLGSRAYTDLIFNK